MNSNREKKIYLREDKVKKKIFLILNKFLIIFSIYLSFLIPENAGVYREVFSFSLWTCQNVRNFLDTEPTIPEPNLPHLEGKFILE